MLGALGEDLEFPLATSNFLVDAFKVDAGLKTKVGVLLNEGAAVGVFSAHGAVVEALWTRVATNGETEGELCVNVHDEIFLLVAKPEIVVIVVDGCSSVAGVRRSVGVQHFAHDQVSVHALGVGEDVHGLQQAVGGAAIGLLGGGSVKHPNRALFNRATKVRPDHGLASHVLCGFISVEPNVLQFCFIHHGYQMPRYEDGI